MLLGRDVPGLLHQDRPDIRCAAVGVPSVDLVYAGQCANICMLSVQSPNSIGPLEPWFPNFSWESGVWVGRKKGSLAEITALLLPRGILFMGGGQGWPPAGF